MSQSPPTSLATETNLYLTRHEEATLKTALAFVVLRNKTKKRKIEPFDFCRNLLTPSLPLAPVCDTSHVQNMLRIALSVAAPLSTEEPIYISSSQASARLEAVASHIARHLQHANDEWLWSWMEDCITSHDVRSICSIWHCISESLSLRIMGGVGLLLVKVYQDQVILQKADDVVVNLLFLLEALVSKRLQWNSPECVLRDFVQAVDQRLTLPISVEDLPAFVISEEGTNLSCHSKIMLHLALYDLTLQLTNS